MAKSISDEETTYYYYYGIGSILEGKLKKIETISSDGSVQTNTFEYEAVGKRLSKITIKDSSTATGEASEQVIENTYGTVAFKYPVIPVISTSTSTFKSSGSSCGQGDIMGKISYTYNLDGITAVSLANAQLKTKVVNDIRTCTKVDVTVDRSFTYDDKGRLEKEVTKVLETNAVTSSISYEYDTSDKLKKVTEVLFPDNPALRETSVATYKVDGLGRAYAEKTVDTTSGGVTKHIYENESCFYHYPPNFFFPSGEKSMGVCPH